MCIFAIVILISLASAKISGKPNILFILTGKVFVSFCICELDDQDEWQWAGKTTDYMPHLNSLVRDEGVKLANFFVTVSNNTSAS